MIDLLDRVLTRLFATRLAVWIAIHAFHIPAEKCSLCYTRVRWAQFMLWVTRRLDGIGRVHDKRITWKVRANPLPDGFNLSQLTALVAAPSAPVDYVKESQFPSAADIQIQPQHLATLWWPRTSAEEHEVTIRVLESRANFQE